MTAITTTLTALADVDAQLAEIHKRSENALDLLIRCLIERDTLSNRADVLLDRRLMLLAGDEV